MDSIGLGAVLGCHHPKIGGLTVECFRNTREDLSAKTSRVSDVQIIALFKPAQSGTLVSERSQHTICSTPVDKGRSKFSGVDASLLSQWQPRHDEIRRINTLYAHAPLRADLLKQAIANWMANWLVFFLSAQGPRRCLQQQPNHSN